MAVAAPQPRSSRRVRPAARQKAATKRPVAQRRVANGVAWIVAVAIVLAGVVALNVAVLRANLRIDELSQKRTELRARNAMLESKLATAAGTARIEQDAARDLGLRPADPARTFYVPIAP